MPRIEIDMTDCDRLVVFALDEARYALPLAAVERVMRAVEVTRLPDAPDVIMGVIDVHGEIVAVMDLRRRFGLPAREIGVDDQIIIAHTRKRALALVVDTVEGVVDCAGQRIVAAEEVVAGSRYTHAIAGRPDGIVLIQDLERFLAPGEEAALRASITNV